MTPKLDIGENRCIGIIGLSDIGKAKTFAAGKSGDLLIVNSASAIIGAYNKPCYNRHIADRLLPEMEDGCTMIMLQRSLGQRIRALRTQKGWSQEYLSERCNLYSNHMGQIERGESNVTLSTLLAIARAFDTTVSELFEGLDDGPSTSPESENKVRRGSRPENRKKKSTRSISVSVVFE